MRRKEGGQGQSISQLVCQTPLPYLRVPYVSCEPFSSKKSGKNSRGYQLPPRRCRGELHPEPFRGVRLSWSRLFAFGGNTDLKSIVIIRPMCFFCVRFIHNFSWKIHASDRKSYFFNCHAFKIVFKEKKTPRVVRQPSTISKAKI